MSSQASRHCHTNATASPPLQPLGVILRTVIAIRDGGVAPCAHVVELLEEKATTVTDQLAELRRMKRGLDRLRKRAVGIDPATCAPESVCELLGAGSVPT